MAIRTRGPAIALAALLLVGARAGAQEPVAIRVASFNVQDVRTSDLKNPDHARVQRIAETLQRLRPTIVLVNEIAYDVPGAPGVEGDAEPGRNARRFVDNFLAEPQAPGLKPLDYDVFMAPSNTGMPSGFDLNNDGQVVTSFPMPPGPGPEGKPDEPTEAGRAYAGDCWGFGTFPGQYGMALLVDPRLDILDEQIRTFRLLPWRYMPGNLMPQAADPPSENRADERDADDTDEANDAGDAKPERPWFTAEEARRFRLSSKSHWDVPVRLPNGAVVHMLSSHPTPPAFEGSMHRNSRRNHDEIRFWADYVEGANYFADDKNRRGPLRRGSHFVILGDLNADPEEGTKAGNPIRDLLLSSRRIDGDTTPTSDIRIEGLEPSDTAQWGKRVDYVLPSTGLEPIRAGVWRHKPRVARDDAPPKTDSEIRFPSDHFPVWMELRVPPPEHPGSRAAEPAGG